MVVIVALPVCPATRKTTVNPPDNPVEESVVFQVGMVVLTVTSCSVMSAMTALPVRLLPDAVPTNVPVTAPSRTVPDTAL